MQKGKSTAAPSRKSARIAMNVASLPPPPPPSPPQPRQPPKKRRRKTKKAVSQAEEPISPTSEEYKLTTDALVVTSPVIDMVHGHLSDAWKINVGNPMYFLFDYASPARHFKRGMKYRPNVPFPAYSKAPYDDLTETDCPPPGFMPFAPQLVECVFIDRSLTCKTHTLNSSCRTTYLLQCFVEETTFLDWKFQELRRFEQGCLVTNIVDGKKEKSVVWIEQVIPAPYDRIVSQLLLEDAHGKVDSAHEALRRQAFARRVLNAFDKELSKHTGDRIAWRPRTLTPLLARQLWGVDENYGPSVAAAVGQGSKKPTIAQATSFYLSMDLTHPRWIPNYRHNLVYIPEARWHLGTVLGNIQIGGRRAYDRIQRNQDKLTKYLQAQAKAQGIPEPEASSEGESEDETQPMDEATFPLYSQTEVDVITNEYLEDFLSAEVVRVVSIYFFHDLNTQSDDGNTLSPICSQQLWTSATLPMPMPPSLMRMGPPLAGWMGLQVVQKPPQSSSKPSLIPVLPLPRMHNYVPPISTLYFYVLFTKV
jgi:hypothetical protein